MLRYREFQPVLGTDCLPEQEFSGASCPPSVSIFFSSFLLTAAQKGVSDSGMSAGTLKAWAWRGVMVVRHFVALREAK
ncbi:hypothetical protein F6G07_12085 [Salmonella enterica]|nr:hypothetical protein [Salmonella enterica]EDT6888381.1 hypothetical protein [Salmonella enterica subsp. enterica]HBZ8550540.1 hypothetical protein [Salmonella enterica subsp. houtenae]EEP1365737.1 hypothetical protein [Salmonella enterica]EGO0033397.1 hypothetical protein [Salmonella enterica]